MSDKNKYQQEEQIRRYIQDEMTGAQRNAFERKMQKDPFLAEAVDGFMAFSSEEIFADISLLKAEIKKGKKPNRRYMWLAAASVILLVVSTFFLFTIEEKTNIVLTENSVKTEADSPNTIVTEPQNLQANETEQKMAFDKSEELMIVNDELEIEDSEIETIPVRNNKTQSAFSPNVNEFVKSKKSNPISKNLKMAKVDNKQQAAANRQFVEQYNTEETATIQSVLMPKEANAKRADSTVQATVPVAEGTAMSFMPTSKADSAMEEVVVIGYGVQKKRTLTGAISIADTTARINEKARPRDGWEAYNEYLSFELQHPEIGSPSKKVVVRLAFIVDEMGKTGSFEILSSNSTRYNKEAINLIKNGTNWLPAVKKSIPEKERVKMRLVFPEAIK